VAARLAQFAAADGERDRHPTAYLIGGLVVIETLFHYQGIGSLIFLAANKKDFPMLEAGVLTVGCVFAVASLLADLIYSWLNPRIRFGAAE
jgi:peptide/nickel transport system permease protein